jgi:hypothetical protein
MFLINAQTQDRACICSLVCVKAPTAFRSASKENRVPEWKTCDAIFICDRLVKAGLLAEAEVVVALVEASIVNGFAKEDGRKATLATIKSGMGAAVARVIPLKAGSNNVALVPEEPSAGGGVDDDDELPGVSDTEFALADEFIAEHKTDQRYFAAAPTAVQ